MCIKIKSNTLQTSLKWLYKQRVDYNHNADIWHFRFHLTEKHLKKISNQIKNGSYKFQPLIRLKNSRFDTKSPPRAIWAAQDSLVLKTLALKIQPIISHNFQNLYHLKDTGGLKKAVSITKQNLSKYKYIFKSDVKSFYQSIDHATVMKISRELIHNKTITKLIQKSLKRVETWGGLYFEYNKGVPQGSPLSPLLGAIALYPLDQAYQKISGIFYARYMDDWVVLCKTRRKLREIVKLTHNIMRQLKFELHPDKTYIGKTDKGFDFLGYHITADNLRAANTTLEKAKLKLKRLYEQGASFECIALYWERFWRWVQGGIDDVDLPSSLSWRDFLHKRVGFIESQ